MARKHTFFIVVLLAAAAVSGLFAFVRTVDLAQPTAASDADAGRCRSLRSKRGSARSTASRRSSASSSRRSRPRARPAGHGDHARRRAPDRLGSDEFEDEDEEGDDD